jgi:formylglycine-generating enzyme required for sulfatase activity
MRGSVVGAAVLMAAAIGGMGYLAFSAFSGGKPHSARVTHAADRAATPGGDLGERTDRGDGKAGKGSKPDRPRAPGTVDEPAEAPAAPKLAAPDDPGGGDRPGAAPGATPGGRFVPGARPLGPGGPGGVGDPAFPFYPSTAPGSSAAAAAGAAGQPGGLFPGGYRGDAGSACAPGMVDIGSFCIDALEVSNISYRSFMESHANRRLQPQVCQWNLDYTPSGGPPPADNRPVVGVDWCDAWLYCAWSGKRLCGKTGGGGNNSAGAFADASRSEWYDVCTNGGASQYSYGDSFDGTKCAHAGDDGTLAPVGAIASCVGTTPPYDQVFDMSGNAWEWEDSCAGAAGEKDLCRVRGGGTHSSSAEVSCAMDYLARREQTFKTVGIRCCSNRRPGY